MRTIFLLLALVACGSSDGEDSDEAGFVIPPGTYIVGKTIVAGATKPGTGAATVKVEPVGDKTQFTLSGAIEDGYTCQPRVWLAKLDKSGDATSVKRTQENCTKSISKAAYEALGRNYRLSGTGFIERIADGETQIEIYYDDKK